MVSFVFLRQGRVWCCVRRRGTAIRHRRDSSTGTMSSVVVVARTGPPSIWHQVHVDGAFLDASGARPGC